MRKTLLSISGVVAIFGAMDMPNAWAQSAPPPSEADIPPAETDEAKASADAGTPDQRKYKRKKKKEVKARRPGDPVATEAQQDIEVTGSRLSNGDLTSKVTVITEADIKARGVNSVEELIRTLPRNVATIGSIVNERAKGPLTKRAAPVSQIGALGVSAANLGGLGAGNTLILINGRRIAGAAGIEDGFANLNGIPLSAVERVEITEGGASAVYGSDAIGGVINFILKRGFTGLTLTGRYTDSSTGGHNRHASIFGGTSWGSGSITATLDYSKQLPVINRKTGWVTQDYSSYFNGDPSFDTRTFFSGLQPGVIVGQMFGVNPVTGEFTVTETGLSVPKGFVGVPEIGDFIPLDPKDRRTNIPIYSGSEVINYSGTINIDQNITDNLSLFINGLYNVSKNKRERYYGSGIQLSLAPGQYYNPFPANYFDGFNAGTLVSYYPGAEIADGTLPVGSYGSTARSWSINAGLAYDINQNTKLQFIYSRSRSYTSGSSENLASLVDLVPDSSAPGGYACSNFLIQSVSLTGDKLARLKAAFDKQCQALTSTDANLAFNPWKSTASGGSSVRDFLYVEDLEDRSSILQNFEARLNGSLFRLPAGRMQYALGGEYNTDGVNSDEVKVLTGQAVQQNRYGFFVEANVPVFGNGFTLPLIRSLTFNIAARSDTYLTKGAIGTQGNVPFQPGAPLQIGENKFSRITPAYGVNWQPFDWLELRGKWTNGFKAPPFTSLFNVLGTSSSIFRISNDPLYTCTTDCDQFSSPLNRFYTVPLISAPNPDLKPQTSSQMSLSGTFRPTGLLDGLILEAGYNRTVIKNLYARFRELNTFLKSEQILALPDFFPRDPNGKVTQVKNLIFNLSQTRASSLNLEASYSMFTDKFGVFNFGVNYLKNIKSESRLFDNSPWISMRGTSQGPDRYKIGGNVQWSYDNINAAMFGYYSPGYINDYELTTFAGVVSNPKYAIPVSSYITFDMTATWKISKRYQFNFAGRNIFDAKPPFVVIDSRPYDAGRYNVSGRTLALEFQYTL